MADFENEVVNNEVAEQEVETVEVYDETTGKWTKKEIAVTGLVAGTSLVGTGFILYKVGKPIVEGTKEVAKKAWNGLKGLFGKKDEEEEQPKPKKKAAKKDDKKATEKKPTKKSEKETEK